MRTPGACAGAVACALLWFGVAAAAPDLPAGLKSDIEAGHRARAVTQLQQDITQHPERAELTYRLGLIAPLNSGNYLRNTGGLDSDRANEERLLALARYHLAAGEPLQAMIHASRDLELFPRGERSDEAHYLLAQAEIAAGKTKDAEARFDWLSRNGSPAWRGWGLYGQGQAALARGDTTEALRLFRATAGLNHHPSVAPALLKLGELYDRRGKISDAFRYLSMYREAYPNGILPLVEHASARSSQADVAAGLTYTVQVGVFGDRANAERQRKRFKALDYSVSLHEKTVAGNRYTAVWVGKFRTQEAAQRAREKLEAKFGETYRVVIFE